MALPRLWPLGLVSYHIRNICHGANEFIIKADQVSSFRMRQQSAKKPENQSSPIKAVMVHPIFASWDEGKHCEGEGGENQRETLEMS